jgi:hypothetical protein
MKIAPIDQGHANRRVFQRLGGIEAAKAPTEDDDVVIHLFIVAHLLPGSYKKKSR